MSYLEQVDTAIALYIGLALFIFILFIYALYCLASIKNSLKSFVDLEYKKYKESKNESFTSEDSELRVDKPEQQSI